MLALSIKGSKIENLVDIKYSHILLYINNALYKLIKYQKLLLQSSAYTSAITISPTL